jgi:hypothetical protein
MPKYHNKKTQVFGYLFDSKREADRYLYLRSRLEAGEINNLNLQVQFVCDVNEQHVCNYIADFTYYEGGKYYEGSKLIIEDSKGVRTPEYRIKKKLVEAIHKVEIIEV